tara:strand:+ start:880 stop:1749 length:870 start_codon:yes stop_codon:yes gene_type:complete
MNFLGDLFGSKPEVTSVATTTSGPPAYAEPYLKDAFKWAQDLYKTPREYYPGQSWVDFSPATAAALDRGEARAMAGSPLVSGAQHFVNTAMGGGFTNPATELLMQSAQGDFLSGSNPYLAAAMQPAIDQIQGQFSLGGRLGSGANMSAMTSALAPVYAQNYATERSNQLAAQNAIANLGQLDFQNRMSAAGMAPTLAAEDYTDIGRLIGFGTAREEKTAEKLADAMSRWNFLENEEMERLNNYLAAVKGGTMGSTTSQPIYSDPTSSAIGNLSGLAGAAYLASKVFGGL